MENEKNYQEEKQKTNEQENPAEGKPEAKKEKPRELTPEQIAEIKKQHRIIKLFHFRDYLLLFMGVEIVLSVLIVALMNWNIIPASTRNSCFFSLLLFLVDCAAAFVGTLYIFLGESSPRLFFKTAAPAFGVFTITALLAGKTGAGFMVWCFAPMRVFAMFGNCENLRSIAICCAILAVVILIAFFQGCRIAKKRLYRRLR